MRTTTLAASALTLALLSTSALAGPVPGMVTMDRFDDQTKFATSLTYIGFDGDAFGNVDLIGLRFDLHGQYLTPRGVGGYVTLPIGYLHADNGVDDDSETGLGNIEVGGLYVARGEIPVVLRGGLVLGTADDSDFGPAITNALGRFTDAALAIPDTTWLRLSASPTLRSRSRQAWVRADVGLDVPIDDNDDDVDTAVRLNVGGGLDTGGVAIIGELTNTYDTSDDGNDNDWVTLLGLSARFMGSGDVQPSVTLQVPIDDDFENVVDFLLIFGLEYIVPNR